MDKRWLNLYDQDVPHSLEYPNITLPDILNRTAARTPDYPALTLNEIVITYSQLKIRVDALANALISFGVNKGDRIALLLPNSPTYVIAYYAIVKIGAVVVNLNVISQGEDLLRLLNHSDPKMVVTLDLFLKNVLEVAEQTSLDRILIHSVFGLEKESTLPGERIRLEIVNDLISGHSGQEGEQRCEPDDLAVLQYTSGVTGHPKAVMLTHRSIIDNLVQIDSWNPKPPTQSRSAICIIPFFHVFGMTVCMHLSIFRSYQMVLFPRFDWSSIIEILNSIKQYRPISFPAVPALWAALVSSSETDKYDLSSIEIASGGGSSLSEWIQEKYLRLTGKYISQAYGLSEASSTVFITPFRRPGISSSVGIPLPDTDVKIVDIETGEQELPVGETGEIIFKGPQMMKGYWQDEEKTSQTIRDGWLYTGDLGYMDDLGYFYLVDRKDDLMISSGYNVYPSEVERALIKHPQIKDVTVVGISDQLRGDAITAFIIPESDSFPKRQELISFCSNYLPDYKIPRFFKFRNELPKNKIGKPLRRLLKQELLTSRD
ncbi:long-chain fatty acid--CoA ligase [bacterium]|nr:long-chain fatty acid--CoA ligase [bacterium]